MTLGLTAAFPQARHEAAAVARQEATEARKAERAAAMVTLHASPLSLGS